MERVRWDRRAGLGLATAGALIVCLALSAWPEGSAGRRQARAVPAYRAIPDCTPFAHLDFLSANALQCWFYTDDAAWRIRSHVSAHGVLLLEIETTSAATMSDVVTRIIEQVKRDFSEVLAYVTLVPDTARARRPASLVTVTRLRWTRQDGFTSLDFTRAPQD